MFRKRKVRIQGLSDYLDKKSVHTLYKMAEEDRIPYERVGRDLYFDLDKIDEWMAQQGNADVVQQLSEPTAEQQAAQIADEIMAKV